MDTVSRLIFIIFVALFSSSAWSIGTVSTGTSVERWCSRTNANTVCGSGGYYPTYTAAANWWAAQNQTGNCPWVVRITTVTATQAVVYYDCTRKDNGVFISGTSSQTVVKSTGPGCPPNSTVSGSQCECNLGSKPSGASACSPYSCPSGPGPQLVTEGTSAKDYLCQTDTGGSNYGCTMASGSGIATTDSAGVKTYFQPTNYTGGACNGVGDGSGAGVPAPADEPPREETNAEKCAYGRSPPMCPGTVNGQSVCVSCSGSSKTDTETSATPAGGASAPSGVSAGTKTTTTDCAGSNCTTTTTYKDAAGTVIGTTTSSGVGQGSAGAGGEGGGESAFGASCAAGAASITCDGDAVQCSIAREQFRRQCEFFEKTSDESALANQAKTDGVEGATDHPNRNPTQHEIGTFDQTNLIAGSCPADRTLGSGTASVSIPFSQICGPASSLGLLLVGLTALSCIAIVFKGS